MIVNRVWTEMHKVKGYVVQIDVYTSRKRNCNRMAMIAIIVSSILCFLSSVIPADWIQNRYVTAIIALVTAAIALIKEFSTFIKQPENELIQLDRIRDFYKDYLRQLENIFTLRYNKKSEINDEKMMDSYNKIADTEGTHESDLNRLKLKLTKREENKVIKITREYFQINYPQQ